MAAHGEAVLRQRVCRLRDCLATFFLCSHCDRGQRYCSLACRDQADCVSGASPTADTSRVRKDGLDHRDRQRQYRARRAQPRVTDQGSLSITCSAISVCGQVEAAATVIAQANVTSGRPLWPQTSRACSCDAAFAGASVVSSILSHAFRDEGETTR